VKGDVALLAVLDGKPLVPVIGTGAIVMSEFDVRIELLDIYPRQEPKVFEIGGKTPRTPDRHINPDGDCCIKVWENWLATARNHSFGAFLNGPLNEYFLGQFWFEKT
jgi:hypothetical protein